MGSKNIISLDEDGVAEDGWKGTNGAGHVRPPILEPAEVTVTGLGETSVAVAAFDTQSISRLGMQIDVTANGLDDFQIRAKFHADGDYVNLALVNADYTGKNHPILDTSITDIAIIATGTHWLVLNVAAYYAVQIWAASNNVAGSNLVISAGGMASG